MGRSPVNTRAANTAAAINADDGERRVLTVPLAQETLAREVRGGVGAFEYPQPHP